MDETVLLSDFEDAHDFVSVDVVAGLLGLDHVIRHVTNGDTPVVRVVGTADAALVALIPAMELDLGLCLKTGGLVRRDIKLDIGTDIGGIQHAEDIGQDSGILFRFRLLFGGKCRNGEQGDKQAQRQQCRDSFSHNSPFLV